FWLINALCQSLSRNIVYGDVAWVHCGDVQSQVLRQVDEVFGASYKVGLAAQLDDGCQAVASVNVYFYAALDCLATLNLIANLQTALAKNLDSLLHVAFGLSKNVLALFDTSAGSLA